MPHAVDGATQGSEWRPHHQTTVPMLAWRPFAVATIAAITAIANPTATVTTSPTFPQPHRLQRALSMSEANFTGAHWQGPKAYKFADSADRKALAKELVSYAQFERAPRFYTAAAIHPNPPLHPTLSR